ncbi:putative TetR family transcriptional regulator [Gordonia effusa NBRC 100432]|uniref:Putative TetR family transcriptional regulator n=1 Tax=Gordonia effusa NBRC 100432 TaxID=1077974 RepID=H0R588_9ACTN|nr:TetR/AcrR family transcriptional regulator [Gordonia effusa]GAB20239.1 putative TetR family transcriptional regulator [Gordonia effusa NBRC 100432]
MARSGVVRDYGGVSADDRREERRLKLIAVGRQMWGRAGIADITVRGICKESGLVYRYFYEHFANRDAFIRAVADQVRDEMVAALVDASSAAGGPVDQRLRAALTGYLTTLDADPAIFRILTSDVSGIAGLADRHRETLDLIADVMVAHVAELPEAPAAGDADTYRIARFVVGGVNRLIEAWLAERDLMPSELADVCVRLSMAAASAG